ncbi:MAG: pyridoxamine 5'-phosphate oxidase family protein [Oscillospiraceae bacterium]|jgi:general stress protein 26|nr:pyridoxamine 5'-phosphate oxidase family protein [Oscillospiraceae bacterium]
MMHNPKQTIGKLIDKQGVAFIASVDADGVPNMKAMLPPRKREDIKVFYFSTNTSSERVAQYCANPKASIYFYSKCLWSYHGVMLKGVMEVLTDDESKKMIWKKGDTIYYSGGVTDPDYCVLRFTATTGRYYANFKTEDFEI